LHDTSYFVVRQMLARPLLSRIVRICISIIHE